MTALNEISIFPLHRQHGEEQTKGEKTQKRLPSGQQAHKDQEQSQSRHHRPQTRELFRVPPSSALLLSRSSVILFTDQRWEEGEGGKPE